MDPQFHMVLYVLHLTHYTCLRTAQLGWQWLVWVANCLNLTMHLYSKWCSSRNCFSEFVKEELHYQYRYHQGSGKAFIYWNISCLSAPRMGFTTGQWAEHFNKAIANVCEITYIAEILPTFNQASVPLATARHYVVHHRGFLSPVLLQKLKLILVFWQYSERDKNLQLTNFPLILLNCYFYLYFLCLFVIILPIRYFMLQVFNVKYFVTKCYTNNLFLFMNGQLSKFWVT